MVLGRKLISPNDSRLYSIDYNSFMALTETLASFIFAVDSGPATVPSYTISADQKSVTFMVTGALATTPTFNVTVRATTSSSQIKNDHVEFEVVNA